MVAERKKRNEFSVSLKRRGSANILIAWLSLLSLTGLAQQPDSMLIDGATHIKPYALRTGRELTLAGAGLATLGTSVALSHTVDPLTPAVIRTLDPSEVNAFDRSATRHWSTAADHLSDATLTANIALMGLLTLGTRPMRQQVGTVAVLYAETMLLANGIGRTVKAVTQRTRPYVFNPAAPFEEKIIRDARRSFFSGHASNAFATAVFTGEVFRHYFPQSRLKAVVWTGALGLATATAVLRYEGGLHYPSDLLAGAAFGSLVGWGIPKLHDVKNRSALGRRLDIKPWSNGPANGIYVQLLVFSR